MAYRDGKSDCGLLSGGGTEGSGFLPPPDQLDESTSQYFYFGWESVNGGWLIRRQDRATSGSSDATISNNPGHLNLTSAWAERVLLTYS